ncbi:MAG: dihydroorotase [Saprospiraceae bacterium]|nr:dihydroorotase [Saprospiraceae bacterium]
MLQLLLRNIRIVSPNQPDLDGQIRDIFIKNGKIVKIDTQIETDTVQGTLLEEGVKIFEQPNACVSIGWFDVGTQTGDPGFEHREDLESVAQAAAAGGFTGLAPFPNTEPAIHSKSEILYIKNRTQSNIIDFEPIGALSVDCKGKDLAEMLDMRSVGAVAFSDGRKSVQDSGLLLRGLQYAKIFDGLVFNRPNDKTIAPHGEIHEGEVSTSLGLSGIPSMAEELMIQRDLHLVEYADSRLHFHNISTARAVELVREGKAKGLRVTASVAALNLCFTDDVLRGFDTHFKVMPPLREEHDRHALIEGLKDGTIDFVTTNHTPIDEEGKNLEFPYADFGAIGLETTFGILNETLSKNLTINDLVQFLAIKPRQVLGLELPKIKEGAKANLTLFDTEKKWAFTEKDIHSKSKNSPLIGRILRGAVLGVVNNGKTSLK